MGRYPDWTMNCDHGVPIEHEEAVAQGLVDFFNAVPNRICDYRVKPVLGSPGRVYIEFKDAVRQAHP